MREWASDSAALVFVYGSLKRGQGHHDQMRGCAWHGEADLNGLALYDLGPFPMAVPSSDPTARLQGELYAVQGTQLARLDRFEGAPRLYERQRWQLSDGRAVWVYVGRARQVRHVRRIPSGCWRGRGMEPALALVLGTPYFSTDSCAAQRALEIGCEVVLMAKGVDGVYDDDPRTNPAAKRYENLSHDDVLTQNLKVADATAISLCRDNDLPIVVFNLLVDGNIARAVRGEQVGTLIKTSR